MKVIILISALLICSSVDAQNNQSNPANIRVDTLECYDVNLTSNISPQKEEYFVNNKRVTKEQYEKYKIKWDNIGRCTPCYLKSFDENDKLISEGMQYMDCGIGKFKAYYPNGNIKTIGQYKENTSGDWTDLYKRGYCSVAVGTWYYYYPDGDLLKEEKYINGKLIE